MFSMATGDDGGGLAAAGRAYALGCTFGVPDLQALGLTFQGYIRAHQGGVAEGISLMDEGMTWAVGGKLAPVLASLIFCYTIRTCYELGDYRRAAEWMEAIEDCFARTGITTFPGDCQAHSVGVLVGRGAWSEGETGARQACADFEPLEWTHVGRALAEIGEIRLRMGDLAAAEEAFARAVAMGATPHPGLALLQLARGDPAASNASISLALAEQGWDRLARARLLPAQVEIALARLMSERRGRPPPSSPIWRARMPARDSRRRRSALEGRCSWLTATPALRPRRCGGGCSGGGRPTPPTTPPGRGCSWPKHSSSRATGTGHRPSSPWPGRRWNHWAPGSSSSGRFRWRRQWVPSSRPRPRHDDDACGRLA
jgi:hypothetical protein